LQPVVHAKGVVADALDDGEVTLLAGGIRVQVALAGNGIARALAHRILHRQRRKEHHAELDQRQQDQQEHRCHDRHLDNCGAGLTFGNHIPHLSDF